MHGGKTSPQALKTASPSNGERLHAMDSALKHTSSSKQVGHEYLVELDDLTIFGKKKIFFHHELHNKDNKKQLQS